MLRWILSLIFGSSQQPQPQPRPTPPLIPKVTETRDFDRSFIMLGKASSGKSTLGNLLLWKEDFKMHKYSEAFGLTKEVHSCDTELDPRIVYGESQLTEPLKIQVLDQPGSNDSDFNEENYGEFLMKCIAESKGEMCANFLIIINLKSNYLSNEECITLMNQAELLYNSSYNFFPNAVIVFTHADKIDPNLNGEILEQELRNMIGNEDFENFKTLIKLVEDRYMFINGANHTEENRNYILKKLFNLTRTTLNVYINGNNGFRGKELKRLLGVEPDANIFKYNLVKYDLECHFTPDMNIMRKQEKINLEEEIAQALEKLTGISKGVSVIIILISLEEMFNKEVNEMVLNIPSTYNIRKEFLQDFWDYACVVFMAPIESDDLVQDNLNNNYFLKNFVLKVNKRYNTVSDKTSKHQCCEKILDLVRKVKLQTEGKTYIDSTVLAEMSSMVDDSTKQNKFKNKENFGAELDNVHMNFPIFKMKNGPGFVIKANDFFWKRGKISTPIGYFILKNINSRLAESFHEEFQHQKTVSAEEFLKYCEEWLKKVNHF